MGGFCTENHRGAKNNYCGGLDGYRKIGILTNGSGVAEPSRGITVGSKKRLPSVIPSEGQEVDPIVRFFTSTG
jgi:hypothetical protein